MVLPVAPLVSPSHFGLRLLEREEEVCEEWPSISSVYVVPFYLQVSHLVGAMTANPPGSEPGWTIGKNQTLALLHSNQWFRGVAVRKTGDQYTIYRIDLGDIVTVPKSFIRPLPPTFCRWNVFFSLSPVILDASCLLPGCLQLAFSAVWLEQTRLRVKTGVWSLLR